MANQNFKDMVMGSFLPIKSEYPTIVLSMESVKAAVQLGLMPQEAVEGTREIMDGLKAAGDVAIGNGLIRIACSTRPGTWFVLEVRALERVDTECVLEELAGLGVLSEPVQDVH